VPGIALPVDELREDDQRARDQTQVDLIICRSHLAAFFWQLHHVLEALESAIRRGEKKYPNERYFYSAERKLESIRQSAIPQEIDAYRNEGHNIPASNSYAVCSGDRILASAIVVRRQHLADVFPTDASRSIRTD
jgi:hypothetical protein